jgi:EspA/EspE family
MGFMDAVEHIGDALAHAGKGVAGMFDDAELVGGLIPVIHAGMDDFVRSANSPILAGGQAVIARMRRTTGTGEPDVGEQFGQGSRRFRDASDELATADPTDDWTGGGADAYGAANRDQRGRTATVTDLDRDVQTVIAREAAQLDFHRSKLDDQSNWLADVGRTTFEMGLIPGGGPAMKAAVETQAVITAVGSSSTELATLSDEVGVNAAAVQELVGQYEQVSGSMDDSAPITAPAPPPGGSDHHPTDRPPGEDQPSEHSSDDAPLGGGSAGGGGDVGTPSADAPAPPAPPTVPYATVPALSQAPMTGSAPAVPGAMAGLPPAMGAVPAGAGAGVTTATLGQLIQAAVQHAFDQQHAAEQAREEKRADEAAQKDPEEDGGDPENDEDGDGISVAEEGTEVRATAGAASSGLAPVHVEFDVDPERMQKFMTVTLDGDHPILVPPTVTT